MRLQEANARNQMLEKELMKKDRENIEIGERFSWYEDKLRSVSRSMTPEPKGTTKRLEHLETSPDGKYVQEQRE